MSTILLMSKDYDRLSSTVITHVHSHSSVVDGTVSSRMNEVC